MDINGSNSTECLIEFESSTYTRRVVMDYTCIISVRPARSYGGICINSQWPAKTELQFSKYNFEYNFIIIIRSMSSSNSSWCLGELRVYWSALVVVQVVNCY